MLKSNAQPTARVINLTPELAAEYLNRNPRNRKVSPRNYATIVRAITNGEWELNGEAIKIDASGFILDGQHRCHAVVEAGIAIKTFLIENLPATVQDTMDTGKSRTLADILAIRGEVNANTVAAIARRIYISRRVSIRAATMASYPTTNKECLRFFDDNDWIRELTGPAKKVARFAKLPASLAGLLIASFSDIDTEDADYFFEHLMSGAELEPRSPILMLRSSLASLHDSKGTTNQTYMAALTIKAWNKFRAGESVGTLKFTPGGANPEKFPEPK